MRFLDVFKKSDGRGSYRVKILSGTIAESSDGDRRHFPAGAEIVVSSSEYANLCAGGKAELISHQPGAAQQARPKPTETRFERPRVEREEPPAELKDWPKVFEDAWRLHHEAGCRRRELDLARRQNDQSMTIVVGLAALEREKGELKVQRIVADCEEKLNQVDFRKLFLEKQRAADLLVEEVRELNEMLAEVREIAFAAFCERLSPLGLHPNKAESLFVGSALYQKFGTLSPLSAGTRRFRGDDCDIHRTYGDDSLITVISHFRTARSRRPEIERLLREAKAELTAAKKAMKSFASA